MFGFIQFVVFTLAGFLVSFKFLSEKVPALEKVKDIAEKLKIYVGLGAVFVGVWSLFSPYVGADGRKIDFLGDLVPSVLSIASGLLLATVVFKYVNFSEDMEKSNTRRSKIQETLEKYSIPIGLATLAFGFIHLIDIIAGGYPLI